MNDNLKIEVATLKKEMKKAMENEDFDRVELLSERLVEMQKLQTDAKMPKDFIFTLKQRERKLRTMKMKNKTIKAAAIAGAVVIAGGTFCYANPVIASGIPIIGKIFEQVEHNVTFSGNYENKEVLQTESYGSETELVKNGDGVYNAESNGVTISASEVYCDGYSVYLTTKIQVKDGGLNNVADCYTSRWGDTTTQVMSGFGEHIFNGGNSISAQYDIEGKSVDDHTFVGMVKIDKGSYSTEDGKIHLKLSELTYVDKRLMGDGKENEEVDIEDDKIYEIDEIDNEQKIIGEWELVIPYIVDQENSKEIVVNKKSDNGYNIDKVIISPYQVVVFSDVPYTTKKDTGFTKEEFEELYGEKNRQLIADGEEAITYEEILNEKEYEYFELAVFDRDGKALDAEQAIVDGQEKSVFCVKDQDISKIHLYVADEEHSYKLLKARDEKTAAENSFMDTVVDAK